LPTNNPYWLPAPDPFPIPFATQAKFNPATHLSGDQNFGPVGPGKVSDPNSPLYAGPGLGPNIISRNLTPDNTGNPAGGIDLPRFIAIMRAGHDFDTQHLECGKDAQDNCYSAPVDGSQLQIMPRTKLRNMTNYQMMAIWTYLSTAPCNAHNDDIGKQFPLLQNTCK